MINCRDATWQITTIVLLSASSANASLDSIGPNGINTVGLLDFDGVPLTGAGVVIGQVEQGRPGDQQVGDDLAHRNTTTDPADVFLQDDPGDPTPNNENVRNHAQEVAGVMISTDISDLPPNSDGDAPKGVATGALLYSSGYITPETDPGYEIALLTMQFIATRPGMRAVNHSWGKPTEFPGDPFDGNSQLTLGLDWSARKHNVLHLVAGNQGGGGLPVPKDNYNGMTIGRSTKASDGVFRQVSTGNNFDEDADGDRTSISLLAPGDNIELTGLGNVQRRANGSSYATPHVTGTVALLGQYAEERIMDGGWNATSARRHEVMKAVLMNSADKLKDDGTFAPMGSLLGMERTVLDLGPNGDGLNGRNWLQSEAYGDEPFSDASFTPLDDQMGAGHLNAKRAVQQFAAGEFNSDGADVPRIGWDYGMTSGENDINKYAIDQQLLGGSFISITMAWDRVVNFFVDNDFDGNYDFEDQFEPWTDLFPPADDVINDLDLYLLPAGSDDLEDAIAASLSNDSTIEHLFFEIPATGQYEFWVHQWDEGATGGGQDYGIAWWSVVAPTGTSQGDYDGNGTIEASDYNIWKANFGTANDAADGNGNGIVDAADYTVWRDHLGQMIGSGSLASVPEPTAMWMMTVTAHFGVYWQRRRN